MSEFAQQRLEKLLPVFEEIERVQLFTKDEVRKVIKKCKSYEHKLEKQTKTKDDFVKYAQYMIRFLALIRERRRAIKYFYKLKEIDYAVSARIESILRAACNRFQGDVKLWLSRIEFAKSQQLHISVSRIFMRLLQVHTTKPHLWIAAAKWEFEENGSAQSARALLQRAMRFNTDEKKLYIEAFRLELLYIEKLKRRNEVLQLSTCVLSDDAEDGDQNVPAEMNENGSGDVKKDVESDAVLDGELARLVFYEAAQRFKGNVDICVQLAKIAGEFSFAQNVVDYIYDFIDKEYADKEARYAALAERHYTENQFDLDEPGRILDEGVEKFDSDEMWRQYIQFYLRRVEDASTPDRSRALSLCMQVFERACVARPKSLDEEYYKKWISLCGDLKLAGEVAENALKRFPKSIVFWQSILQWKIAGGSPEKEVMQCFNRAVGMVHEKDTLPLWTLALDWAVQLCPWKVEGLFEASQVMDSSISGPLKSQYLEWILLNEDTDSLREKFRQLSQRQPNSLEFYWTYHRMELSQPRPDADSIRFCMEQTVNEHGRRSVDAWLRYAQFESQHPRGDPARGSVVYGRAIKALEGDEKVQEFMKRYIVL